MTCMMYVETNVDKCIMNTKHWLLKEEENVTPQLTRPSDVENIAQQTSESEKVFFSLGLKDTDRYRECQQLQLSMSRRDVK